LIMMDIFIVSPNFNFHKYLLIIVDIYCVNMHDYILNTHTEKVDCIDFI